MKQRLLFGLMILMSSFIFSQVSGPPPAGYTGLYFCDDENYDGIITIDLTSLETEVINGSNLSDYFFTYTYRLSFGTDIFPLENPNIFTNSSNGQVVYIKATHKVTNYWLSRTYEINVVPLINISEPSPLVVCNVNSNGINTFKLKSKNDEILAGLNPYAYSVNYFESLQDAQNTTNEISDDAYENITNPQTIYARVETFYTNSCFEIVPLEIKVLDVCKDIAVYLTSQAPPRPGFDYINYLVVKNVGSNLNVSGSVEFVYDGSINLIEVSQVDSGNTFSNTSTGFVLNFNNLTQNNKESVRVKMKVPAATSLGARLTNMVSYNGNDVRQENNISTLTETVVGSYDPNDILETHGPKILYNSFDSDDYLFYNIRFQNIGTADAVNVKIDNTLDALLDKSTIQMLDSSHSNVFTRSGNQLNWQFDNIHLPSESMDEPASHGFVYYKIKPLAGYGIGDIIPNTAEIYFDFNEPVITNTFNTQFIITLSNTKFNDTEFSIFPNPANHLVVLKFNKNINSTIKIAVYDIQGKQIANEAKAVDNSTVNLNVSQWVKGMYFLKVNDGISEITKKLIVK